MLHVGSGVSANAMCRCKGAVKVHACMHVGWRIEEKNAARAAPTVLSCPAGFGKGDTAGFVGMKGGGGVWKESVLEMWVSSWRIKGTNSREREKNEQ